MTTIIGVDFSGAKEEGKTWVAQGRLLEDGSLWLDSVQPALRDDLYQLLPQIDTPAVVAMDFPFGVPRAFAGTLCSGAPKTMPEVWKAVAGKSAPEYDAISRQFVAANGEPKRYSDAAYHRESYSPLHQVNPNMIPMTYEGICLLYRWHKNHPGRWYVPPLDAPAGLSDAVTLLEVMPGAFLKAIGLPGVNPGKAYKSGKKAVERRKEIIDGLAAKSGVALPNLGSVQMGCLANDDCLDAVIAAVCATAWKRHSARFRCQTGDTELAAARLEGWIYAPR